MRAVFSLGLSGTLLILASCGMLGDTGSSEIKLEEFTVTTAFETPAMGPTDRVAAVREGRVLKLGDEKPATFISDTNLLSGPGYLYQGEYSIWLQRGLKDKWSVIYSRDLESTEYTEDYDSSILPLKHTQDESLNEDLSIYLTTQDDRALMLISWGEHRFSTEFTVPPAKE